MLCDDLVTWVIIDYYLLTWVITKKDILMIIYSDG